MPNFPITYGTPITIVSHQVFGQTVRYKVANGTYYNINTADEIVRAIELAREKGYRIRIFMGDAETGEVWQEEHDTMGTVGRSSGTIKIPLLVAKRNNPGGFNIPDDRIVGIRMTGRLPRHNAMRWLYKHPKFDVGVWGIRCLPVNGFYAVEHNGTEFARERTQDKAMRLCLFMRGDRDSK